MSLKNTPNPYTRNPEDARDPPVGFGSTLKFLGPGMILAGSVVGSGELITTTTLGATVGFTMLWWILLSCWSKSVFQAELGRYIISSGDTGLKALNRVPGKLGGISWVVIIWMLILIPFHFGVGGIYGGVGQAVSLIFPAIDSLWWTLAFAILAVALVLSGTYRFLENVLTVMVVVFTLTTLSCAVLLQFTEYALTWSDLRTGLSFKFPPFAVTLALGVFGATGVTAAENIAYTYWCTEKGYARSAGPREQTATWAARAKGWIKVMQTDVVLTLVVLTLATVPFYMLGAGVLHRTGKIPNGFETITVLSNMYTETLGTWAFYLFLVGAFFVLFSAVVSLLGASVRTMADCSILLGIIPDHPRDRQRMTRILTVLSPTIMILCYFFVQNPVFMVIMGGLFGAALSPIIAGSVLYLRYRHTDPRLAPSRKTDALLWICFSVLLTLTCYVIYLKVLA